jgi:hypothetical protein
MNRKGTVESLISITVLLFVIGFLAMVGWVIVDSAGDTWEGMYNTSTSDDPHVNQSAEIFTSGKTAYGNLNEGFVMLLGGLILITLIAASQIDAHPVFFFISLFVLAFVVVVGVIFSNMYVKLASTSVMEEAVDEFGIINYVMDNWVMFIIIIGLLIMTVMYAKPGREAGL